MENVSTYKAQRRSKDEPAQFPPDAQFILQHCVHVGVVAIHTCTFKDILVLAV